MKIKNFHLDTVYLIGHSREEENNSLVKFKDSILITPFQTKGDYKEININGNADFIFFKPQNTKKLEVINIEEKLI